MFRNWFRRDHSATPPRGVTLRCEQLEDRRVMDVNGVNAANVFDIAHQIDLNHQFLHNTDLTPFVSSRPGLTVLDQFIVNDGKLAQGAVATLNTIETAFQQQAIGQIQTAEAGRTGLLQQINAAEQIVIAQYAADIRSGNTFGQNFDIQQFQQDEAVKPGINDFFNNYEQGVVKQFIQVDQSLVAVRNQVQQALAEDQAIEAAIVGVIGGTRQLV